DSSVATVAFLYSAPAAKIRALEFAYYRIARGGVAEDESDDRKMAGRVFPGDVLSGCLGRRRNRSDVVDSVERGGSNFSGCSIPLSSPGCATEGDQYCSHSPAGGSHYHFGCDLYRCLFGDANDRRLSQQSRCAGEVRPRSSTDGCGRTSALRNSSRAR